MKIGIVGTGNMGRSLGVLCPLHGHEVYFGARDEQKARAARITRSGVVKAFNTLPMEMFEVEEAELRDKQVSVFLASDSASAKATVRELVEELGFTSFDFGPLRHAGLREALADVFRHAIHQGASLYSCLSIVNLPKPEHPRLGADNRRNCGDRRRFAENGSERRSRYQP